MKKLVCFTLFDFNDPGGAGIRITGVLNALVKQDVEIKLYSIHNSVPGLSPFIKVVQLPPYFRTINKRWFQFVLAYFDAKVVNVAMTKALRYFKKEFSCYKNQPLLFFDYLDITIGYWLNQNNIIDKYITDVHGIAPLEFDLNETKSPTKRILNYIKKQSVLRLDRKIYSNAFKVIYTSKRVQSFLQKLYDIENSKAIIVEEAINQNLIDQKVNKELKKSILDLINYNENNTILFFAGKFKQFGGVADLIKAYIGLRKENDELNTKLILVGYGELANYCKSLVKKANLSNEVFFLGPRPYSELKTFHDIVDIIICPDKDTPYSQSLPHIKYFDSISSGKIVINGMFQFTDEINPDQKFSLNFEPSNIESLKEQMKYAIDNKGTLQNKFYIAKEQAVVNFSYENSTKNLYKVISSL